MRKAFLLVILCAMFTTNIFAQRQRMSEEQMEARRTEMVQRQAENLAKEMNLDADAKKAFIQTYTDYQNELAAIQKTERAERMKANNNSQNREYAKLSDQEAKERIDKYFANQEMQIAASLARLQTTKKYYEELQKLLTPQQLVLIFAERRNNRNNQEGAGQRGGFSGSNGGRQGGLGGNNGGFDNTNNSGWGGNDF